MSILHSPESAFAKESVKWEALPTTMGPGLRPYVHYDYPAVIYRAKHDNGGGFEFDSVLVTNDTEAANFFSRGYYPDPLAAIEGLKAHELDVAKLAAERAYEVKHKLSPKAVAEVAAAEAAHSGHLPTMPETPIKRRGRPKKASGL